MASVHCHICAGHPGIGNDLKRINEKGVPGIWECIGPHRFVRPLGFDLYLGEEDMNEVAQDAEFVEVTPNDDQDNIDRVGAQEVKPEEEQKDGESTGEVSDSGTGEDQAEAQPEASVSDEG